MQTIPIHQNRRAQRASLYLGLVTSREVDPDRIMVVLKLKRCSLYHMLLHTSLLLAIYFRKDPIRTLQYVLVEYYSTVPWPTVQSEQRSHRPSSTNYELKFKCKHAKFRAFTCHESWVSLKGDTDPDTKKIWADTPYQIMDSLLSPTNCVHQLEGP
jgi:hypothetical protein